MTARPSHARSGGDPQRPTSSSRCRISVRLPHHGKTAHAVGGRTLTARYKTVDLRLHPADPTASHYLEWQAQVGFIGGWHSYSSVLLGSVGFLDQWTVTASRFAQAVAIEPRDESLVPRATRSTIRWAWRPRVRT